MTRIHEPFTSKAETADLYSRLVVHILEECVIWEKGECGIGISANAPSQTGNSDMLPLHIAYSVLEACPK